MGFCLIIYKIRNEETKVVGCLLCTRCCFGYFTYVGSFNPQNIRLIDYCPFLRLTKQGLKEIKNLPKVQGK